VYREDLPAAPLVITTFNKQVIALNVSDGSVAWKTTMPAARVVVEGSVAYVVGNDGEVVALDYETGTRKWSVETGLSALRVTLLVARDVLFVSFSGEMACIAKGGKLLWKNGLPGTGYGAAGLAVPGIAVHGDHGDNSG
jgi:hypothetical protein